ncbi:hypothetical protein OAL15_04265 [Flavobacteriales bacterium]|nr:hypothetical protein [Flavobacteriales bacterium]
MKILCTYCSANKQTVVGNVPAISRYISKRIDWVAKQADKENYSLTSFLVNDPDSLHTVLQRGIVVKQIHHQNILLTVLCDAGERLGVF